ncbi:MAG: ABC transporter ATP-binding protein [Ignavibacteria bacterium]|nr:ABC transporter ATP-binding protein [Ignavibacteria bacterium]MDP3832048.1 ABC transporter ATP-binding protein [Ignavibacteriaceae bacterium]
MNEFIIEAKSISKSYLKSKGTGIDVLKDISINVKRNKISVIVGASGAGKSTLLHILSGLDKADKGEVFIDGKMISNLSERKISKFRNEHFGFVFQFHHLLPEFTALENCMIPLMIKGLSKREASKQAEEYLNLIDIGNRKNHKPAELSGGEQQRVAVARALVVNAPLIFADEPSGNLDTINSDALHQLFIKLRDDYSKSFLIVTHNKELVRLADEVFEIKDGKLISN